MSAFVDSANLRNKSVLLFLRICEENTENIEFCAKKSNCMKLHCNFIAIPRYLHSKLFKLVLSPFLCGAGCSMYIKDPDPGQDVLYQGSGSGAGCIISRIRIRGRRYYQGSGSGAGGIISRIRIWIQIWLCIYRLVLWTENWRKLLYDVNCCFLEELIQDYFKKI